MTRAELKPLYVEATIRARVKPQRSEEDMWFKQLEYASARDLQTAINAWFDGGSKWMPKENEIKPLVEQAERKRMVEATTTKELVRWKCPTCKLPACGMLDPVDFKTRNCPRCGHRGMVETYRRQTRMEAA